MDSNNFTPLPDSLRQDLSTGKLHRFKLPDVVLIASFVLFVMSVGYWVQSTVLQPSTNATQKIIEATPTPTPTVAVEMQESTSEEDVEETPAEELPAMEEGLE